MSTYTPASGIGYDQRQSTIGMLVDDNKYSMLSYSSAFGIGIERSAFLLPGVRDVARQNHDIDTKFQDYTETVDSQLAYIDQNMESMAATINAQTDEMDAEHRAQIAVNSSMMAMQNEVETCIEKMSSYLQANSATMTDVINDIKALKEFGLRTNSIETAVAKARLAADTLEASQDMVASIPFIGGTLAAGGKLVARGLNAAADSLGTSGFTSALTGLMGMWRSLTTGKFNVKNIFDVLTGKESTLTDAVTTFREHASTILKLSFGTIPKILSGSTRRSFLVAYVRQGDGRSPTEIYVVGTDIITDARLLISITHPNNATGDVRLAGRIEESNGIKHNFGDWVIVPDALSQSRFPFVVSATQGYKFAEVFLSGLSGLSIDSVAHAVLRFLTEGELPSSLVAYRGDIMRMDASDPHPTSSLVINRQLLSLMSSITEAAPKPTFGIVALRSFNPTSRLNGGKPQAVSQFIVSLPASLQSTVIGVKMIWSHSDDSSRKLTGYTGQPRNFYRLSNTDQDVVPIGPTAVANIMLDSFTPRVIVTTNALHVFQAASFANYHRI